MHAEGLFNASWAGVDEVGRGPLIGAVVTAAVILPDNFDLPGLTDSKKLSAKKREALAIAIKTQAIAWCVAESSVEEIDHLNILQATLLAMRRAVDGLSVVPQGVYVDGNRCPKNMHIPCQAVVKGDGLVPAISAASILAKVARDAQMDRLHEQFPSYGFDQHKGYPTAAHLAALTHHGVLPEHRRSFAPVKALLKEGLCHE
jgi:ribonuclease HII